MISADLIIDIVRELGRSDIIMLCGAIIAPPAVNVWAIFLLREEVKKRADIDEQRIEDLARMREENTEMMTGYRRVIDNLQEITAESTAAMVRLSDGIRDLNAASAKTNEVMTVLAERIRGKS